VESTTWLLKLIGDQMSASDYVWHRDLIHQAGRKIATFFSTYDVLLTPTAALPPVAIGAFAPSAFEMLQMRLLKALPLRKLLMLALDKMAEGPLRATPNTMLFNLTGQPAMSTPLHWNEAGLPIGTQWVGGFGDEATLFQLAAQLEEAQPWSSRKP